MYTIVIILIKFNWNLNIVLSWNQYVFATLSEKDYSWSILEQEKLTFYDLKPFLQKKTFPATFIELFWLLPYLHLFLIATLSVQLLPLALEPFVLTTAKANCFSNICSFSAWIVIYFFIANYNIKNWTCLRFRSFNFLIKVFQSPLIYVM